MTLSYAKGLRLLYRSLFIFFVSTLVSLLLLNRNMPTTSDNNNSKERPRLHHLQIVPAANDEMKRFEFIGPSVELAGNQPGDIRLAAADGTAMHQQLLVLIANNVTKVIVNSSGWNGDEQISSAGHTSSLSSTLVNYTTFISSMLKEIQPLCPVISNKLVGWINISIPAILKENKDIVQYKMIQSGVTAGGRYEPSECRSRHKIAVVVPVRNRSRHLAIFTRYMHPFLQRQQLDYTVIVVEQSRGSPFNRGMLMNIGFKEALLQDQEIQCFFFHDVDLLPEHDGNPYTCPEDGQPKLMTFSIDNWDNYTPTPDWHFGGVTALSTGDFLQINGFSNVFWGWGGEDNDLLERIRFHNMTETRTLDQYPTLVQMGWARYKTLVHQKAAPSKDRIRLLDEGPKRMRSADGDGLTNLKYNRIDLRLKLLYTHVLVDIQQ